MGKCGWCAEPRAAGKPCPNCTLVFPDLPEESWPRWRAVSGDSAGGPWMQIRDGETVIATVYDPALYEAVHDLLSAAEAEGETE